eukprot:4005585-Prymnesium_polylepis.1
MAYDAPGGGTRSPCGAPSAGSHETRACVQQSRSAISITDWRHHGITPRHHRSGVLLNNGNLH